MMGCIDLKKEFGDVYRLVFEEAYKAERPEFRKDEEAWLRLIPCRNGQIFPYGGRMLAAFSSRPSIRKSLDRLVFGRIAQWASDGATLVFDVKHFDEVSEVMLPKRKRRLSEEHRRKLSAAGKAALARHRETTSGLKA